MRITIVSDVFAPTRCDGVATTVSTVCQHLEASGHELQLIGPKNMKPDSSRALVRPQLSIQMLPEQFLSFPTPTTFAAIRRFKPDRIIVFDPRCLGILLLLARRLLPRVPVLASYHTDYVKYARFYPIPLSVVRWLLRNTFIRAGRRIAVSRYAKKELEKLGADAHEVWTGGVDRQRFHPRHRCPQMRHRLSAGYPQHPLCISVGRLAPEKELERLEPLMRAAPHVRWAMIGDGALRADLETRFRGLPVTFVGALSGLELSQAFASADLLVHPASTETLGRVLLEARSSNLPVLAFNHGGVADVVVDGVTGRLVECGDEEGLQQAFLEMINDPRLLAEMASNAEDGMAQWSWSHQVSRLAAILQAA